MIRLYLASLFFLFGSFSLFAQYEAAVFDYEMNYFNNGQPLPAEEKILFTGNLTKQAERVEIEVYKGGTAGQRDPLYTSTWKRGGNSTQESFHSPFNFPLKGNSEYDIQIAYFSPLLPKETASLTDALLTSLDLYLEQAVQADGKKVSLSRSGKRLLQDMNELVEEKLTPLRFKDESRFTGLSMTVQVYLDRLEDLELPKDDPEKARKLLDKRIDRLRELVGKEVREITGQGMLKTTDMRLVRNYSTEKIQRSLALNAGYGGVYLSGNADDFSYGAAPYVGISLPLSSRPSNPFLNNTSFTVGAFTQNFENLDGTEISGPIFRRPYFVALGYRVFQFVRINAGMVALEERGGASNDGSSFVQIESVLLRPFIGVSAEIRLSVGLGK